MTVKHQTLKKLGDCGQEHITVTDDNGHELVIIIDRTDFGNMADVNVYLDSKQVWGRISVHTDKK